MLRNIVKIHQEKCIGCGLCVNACHEAAIELKEGKAHLIREDYCDGLGNCLPACPANAIEIIEADALAYDEEAVKKNLESKKKVVSLNTDSALAQWPCQIKLAPMKADYFDECNLLIAADCTAYAYGNFHLEFMKDKITLVGCSKLDNTDYSQKLMMIFSANKIKSITLVKMEVPCCNGMKKYIENALELSGKNIPFKTVTISLKGEILEDER